jgi:Holliday junction resolvase RusA-like endonuclease
VPLVTENSRHREQKPTQDGRPKALDVIRFSVPAVPVAQPRQRHRLLQAGGRTIAVNYVPRTSPVQSFKASVAHEAREVYQGAPLAGPIKLTVLFLMPRPARLRWKKRAMPRCWHASKPDLDNLVKAVKDALKGILWHDDSQVAELAASKLYCSGPEAPSVAVVLEQLTGDFNSCANGHL